MVTERRSRYAEVLGTSTEEQRRLLAQAKDFEPEARWVLDRIGVQPGWRAIDLGCGPLGILDLLSELVGPEGDVVGLDLEPRFVAQAQEFVAKLGLTNVTLVQGNAAATGLPRDSFDLVHARLLLTGPDREPIVNEMVALARPGSWVVTQDIDLTAAFCAPAHPAWDTLLGAFRNFVTAHGADLAVGRRLSLLLRGAGLVDVEAEFHTHLARPGEPRRMQLLGLISSIREPLLRGGSFSEVELNQLMSSLRTHLGDPQTVVMAGLVAQAWGRKPEA